MAKTVRNVAARRLAAPDGGNYLVSGFFLFSFRNVAIKIMCVIPISFGLQAGDALNLRKKAI
jgi:hypothetical protein